MDASVDAGCASTGILPGGLKVKRRAPQIAADIRERHEANLSEPLAMMDWINLWAMAVNEENAAGGRVVTAPTNGAAGIIPAIIRYFNGGCRGDSAGRSEGPRVGKEWFPSVRSRLWPYLYKKQTWRRSNLET